MITLQFTATKIRPNALAALRSAVVYQSGDVWNLDADQMDDRKDYDSFKVVIEACKGKWNGKTHVFPYNPQETIARVIESGFIPVHNPFALFETPDNGIDDLLSLIGLESNPFIDGDGWQILEPSAGTGKIALKLRERFPKAQIDVCEIDPFNQEILRQQGFNIVGDDFLALETNTRYHWIIMNPPFQGTAYIDHVLKAFSLLENHGRMAAIVPNAFLTGSTKKIVSFRNHVAEFGLWEPFEHRFDFTPVKCMMLQLERFSESRLSELWGNHNGYDSWFHYQVEIALDCEREWDQGKAKIALLPISQWGVEIGNLADRLVSRLISKEYCYFVWDNRVKQSVINSAIEDITEGYLPEGSEVETIAESTQLSLLSVA